MSTKRLFGRSLRVAAGLAAMAVPGAHAQEWNWTATEETSVGKVNAIEFVLDPGGYYNGFYAVTEGGDLLASEDASTWTTYNISSGPLYDIAKEGLSKLDILGSGTSALMEPYYPGFLDTWVNIPVKSVSGGTTFNSPNLRTFGVGNGLLAMGTTANAFAWRDLLDSLFQKPGTSSSNIPGNPGQIVDIVYQVASSGTPGVPVLKWWALSTAGTGSFSVYSSPLADVGYSFTKKGEFAEAGDAAVALAVSDDGMTFVAVGGSRVLRSEDGGDTWTSWSPPSSLLGEPVSLSTVRWLNHGFVAGTEAGDIFTSDDGLQWTYRGTPTPGQAIHDVIYGKDLYVAVGGNSANESGWIAISDASLKPSPTPEPPGPPTAGPTGSSGPNNAAVVALLQRRIQKVGKQLKAAKALADPARRARKLKALKAKLKRLKRQKKHLS
jgi:hypothetical protein